MYQDDYPSPPSSAGSSYLASSAILRHSIPHLYSSSPSTHAHAYGQRASKASDIAHLLDPSYSPTGVHHDDNQIYIDHAGEVHDPDFRLFALAPRRVFVPDLDDDDDVEAEGSSLYSARRQPRRASLDSYPARPSSRASRYTTYSYAASAPARTRTATHESPYVPFAYDAECGYASDGEAPRRGANKLRRRRASCEEDGERPPPPKNENAHEPRVEWTPSCAHALRRQWLALCLRTQVAAFRARRRVTRAVWPKTAATG